MLTATAYTVQTMQERSMILAERYTYHIWTAWRSCVETGQSTAHDWENKNGVTDQSH